MNPPLISENNSLQGNITCTEMKFNIHVVDDEDSGRVTLRILLEREFWAHIESLTFSKSFEQAKEKLQCNSFDIMFLDVNLKGLSAFDLMTFIPLATRVVFVTAYSEFMLQALRSKAFDYLVKPIKEEDLKDCLLRLQKELNSIPTSRILHVKQRGLTRVIKHSDILYIKGDGPYSTFYLKEDTCTAAKTLKSILPEIGDGFVRIHKTYIVNRIHIKGYNKNKLILQNDQCLPVSRTGLKILSV